MIHSALDFMRGGTAGSPRPGDRERLPASVWGLQLVLRERRELAGWEPSPCHVLEGQLPDAQQYTVWLDPAHGYRMAKGDLRRTAGCRPCSIYTLQAGEHDRGLVEKVRFAKHGDPWVPVEATGGLDSVRNGNRCSMRFQLKVTKFVLNPDHEALCSFVPDDTRNGAAVCVEGRTNLNGTIIRDEWCDGRMMDKNGQVIMSRSPRLIELRRQPKEPASASVPGVSQQHHNPEAP